MSRFIGIALTVSLLIWVITVSSFMRYSQTSRQQVEERRAEIIVNYATDGAMDSILEETQDLDLDYVEYDRVNVSPDEVLKVFLEVFCKGYGMSLTQDNFAIVKTEYLSAFVVATYEGYYIGTPQVINDSGARDMVFSTKKPYLYVGDDGYTYALNLTGVEAKKYDGKVIRKVDAPISQIEQKAYISMLVSDALAGAVYQQKEGNIESTVYIPTAMTSIIRSNPVDHVTVMAYVGGLDVGFGEKTEILGIGGSQIAHTHYCAGYMKDSIKTYAYEGQVPEGYVVEATFQSPEEAAANGYYFDMSTLSR